MTVKELIVELVKLDPDLEVYVPEGENTSVATDCYQTSKQVNIGTFSNPAWTTRQVVAIY